MQLMTASPVAPDAPPMRQSLPATPAWLQPAPQQQHRSCCAPHPGPQTACDTCTHSTHSRGRGLREFATKGWRGLQAGGLAPGGKATKEHGRQLLSMTHYPPLQSLPSTQKHSRNPNPRVKHTKTMRHLFTLPFHPVHPLWGPSFSAVKGVVPWSPPLTPCTQNPLLANMC